MKNETAGESVRVDLTLRAWAATAKGSSHERNEDSLVVGPWLRGGGALDSAAFTLPAHSPVVCAVIDGLGGAAAGHVASNLVARDLAQHSRDLHTAETVVSWLLTVHDRLYEATQEDVELRGMGATIAGCVFVEGDVHIFNVGDARVYRVEGGFLGQATEDDSVGAGEPNERGRSHIVTQSLGGTAEPVQIAPHITTDRWGAGTHYLLCSDGLSDFVDAGSLEEMLRTPTQAAMMDCIDAAVAAGSHDDVSLILVQPTSGWA